MLGVGFRRLFWIGAAALLGVAALVALVALLRGEFTDTDGSILASLGITLGAGSTALAGLALVERDDFAPLGWAAILVALGGYVTVLWDIWTEPWDDEATATALLLMGAFLLAATSRLLLRRRSLEPLVLAHLVLSTFATTGTVWLIWDDGPTDDAVAKLLGAVWILAALAWFLVPVLGRTSAPSTSAERVVGTGPGRFEVELAEGERLVVQSER
jgi:hypothetical protein